MRDYNKKVSAITFEVKKAKNGRYDVWMQSDSHKVLAGQLDTKEQALEIARKMSGEFESKCVGGKPKYRHERHKISTPTVASMQVVAMGLDPMRAAKFRETIITINFLTHMMTDEFDKLSTMFDSLIDPSTKQHYKIACKHIDALLDAVYQSRLMGATDDDYTAVASAGYALVKRLEMICTYVWKDDWRFKAWDECLSNLIDDAWLEGERMKIGNEMRERITANAHNESAEIKPRNTKKK